jgi:hypothetical protein
MVQRAWYLSDVRPAFPPSAISDAGASDAAPDPDAAPLDSSNDDRVQVLIELSLPWAVPPTMTGPIVPQTAGVEVLEELKGSQFELSIPRRLTNVSVSFRFVCGPSDQLLRVDIELQPSAVQARIVAS